MWWDESIVWFFLFLNTILLYGYITVWLFIYKLLMDIWNASSFFFFLAIMKNDVMSIYVQFFVWTYVCVSLVNSREWNCWVIGKFMFNILRNFQIDFQTVSTFHISMRNIWESRLYTHSTNIWYYYYYYRNSSEFVMVFNCGFNFHFLIE